MNERPNTHEEAPAQGEGAPQPATTATGRIQVIIEAAEKAAAGIIEDAEAQARRYLAESRRRADRIAEERAEAIGDATEGLIERAETVKRHSDELIRALEEAKLRIGVSGGEGGTEPLPAPVAAEPATQPGPRGVAHLKPVEAPPPEGPPEPSPLPPRPPQEPYVERRRAPQGTDGAPAIPTAGARLLATQMAVAGSSRAEIERRLRNDFGIEDAEEMLNGILGPET
jgi:hypothetical protein